MRDKRKVKTNISDFSFEMRGYGQYLVTYTSPTTGKKVVNFGYRHGDN